MADTGDQVFLLVDESRDQLGRVDLAGAHSHELMSVIGKIGVHQLFGIVDHTDGRDRIQTEMRADQERLRIGIADTADPAAALEIYQIFFKFRTEGRVRDRVDLALKPARRIPQRHAGIARTEMAVVIHPEKHVQHHIASGYRAEKASHQAKNSWESVIGSM